MDFLLNILLSVGFVIFIIFIVGLMAAKKMNSKE